MYIFLEKWKILPLNIAKYIVDFHQNSQGGLK